MSSRCDAGLGVAVDVTNMAAVGLMTLLNAACVLLYRFGDCLHASESWLTNSCSTIR